MRRPRSWGPVWALAGAVVVCALVARSGLRLNLTASMPRGLYQLEEGPLERGALLAACLPLQHAVEGRRRGYLFRGRCPGGVSPVLKRVGAMGGDVVMLTVEGVFLNGEVLQLAAPGTDSRGRSLSPLPAGEYRLGNQELWLYTSEPRSWDSRFYGLVPASAVLGRVQPVWTWRPIVDSAAVPRFNERRLGE